MIKAIRAEVGNDFHLQAKLNAVDFGDALYPWEKKGNTLDESIQIMKWAEAAGVDGIHVSIGSIFPHPLLPPGGFPPDELNWWYGGMASSGVRGYMNYTLFHFKVLRPIFLYFWNRTKKHHPIEAVSSEYCRVAKQQLTVPVINTGGYQDARVIRRVISEGITDAVSMARPLIANRDLPQVLAAGNDLPEKPCSFCNRCLVNAIANPLGCYDVRRFNGDHDAMVQQVMKVFDPPPFPVEALTSGGRTV